MKRTFWPVLLAAVFTAGAAEITVDGKLNEPAWKQAEKHSGFSRIQISNGGKKVKAQTEFSVLMRGDRIYFGIKCDEPKMAEMEDRKSKSLWTDDGVEIFLAPSGLSTDYYQFRITAGNVTYTNFFAESGNISPDPYSPEWRSAVHFDKNFWSCEVELPLSAFYMTRQNLWRTEWRVNVARTRTLERENSSWSPLKQKFQEPASFRKLKGFPERKPADDVWISTVNANVKAQKGGKPSGDLIVTVQVPRAGAYLVNGKKFTLKAGVNKVAVPHQFEKSGRNQVQIVCKRVSDGREFKRGYPVFAVYEPLNVQLTSPEYRNNFYPGQDSSKVAGRIIRPGTGKVTLTLSGAGIKTQKKVLDKDLNFTFDTTGLKEGSEAELKAEIAGVTRTVKIRRLAPSKHRMSWISGGNLIVDGKPVLRRNMYATYYNGGEAFRRRFDADNLHLTPEIIGQSGWIEPARLIKGIEQREATRDVRPCDELFRKIDQMLERNRDRDFAYYYISDEPECRNVSPEYLAYIYRYLAEKDPYHVVLMGSRSPAKYINCADWFETHPYINPCIMNGKRIYGREIRTVGRFVDEIAQLERPDKCIGFLPTAFSYKYSSDASQYPTFDEMICHVWVGMIHGGKSLWPYAYHDLGDRASIYEGIRYLFSSFERLQDFILLGKRTFLLKTPDCEAVLYEHGKDRMFVLVNLDPEKKVKASLKNLKGSFVEFRGSRKFNSFDFELKPLEVVIGTSRKMDEGLKSREQVAAEIDRAENARKNRGNILFERHREVEVSASKATGSPYKMFDGITDVVAFSQLWGKERFYEISFPKFVPEFTKVRIYGHNLGDVTVKIRKRGEWLTLKPDQVEKGEFMRSYGFNEKVRTVKIRFEFPKPKLELYEIELVK